MVFDEFNKNSQKMSAVRNFFHSGSIGSTYNLPVKTIAIAAGNLGKSIDDVEVQPMDAATSSRFQATIRIDYDWSSWLKHMDTKDGVRKVDGEDIETGPFAPSIIAWIANKMRQYIDNNNVEEANNFKMTYTSLDLYSKITSNLTPRRLEDIEGYSKSQAINDWENNTLVNKTKEYYQVEYDKKIKQNKISKKEIPSVMVYYYRLHEKHYVARALDAKLGNHNRHIREDYLAVAD